MRNHDWCRNVQRDEAVRAAEDRRSGPLPTLEEAIAAASPLPGRVEGTHWADWERLRAERDAAIRERDEAKQRADRDAVKCIALADAVIGLKARVAELESAAKLAPAANADGGSNHAPAASGNSQVILDGSPPASGAASSEPVAWMCEWADHTLLYDSQTQAEIDSGGDIVPQPLYRSPQPAPGWLTKEEREALELSLTLEWPKTGEQLKALAVCLGPVCVVQANKHKVAICGLLDRQPLPPEVVRPSEKHYHHITCASRDADWLAALAAAGVTCKEANRE